MGRPGTPNVGGEEVDSPDNCSECEASSPEELLRCAEAKLEAEGIDYPWYVDTISFACDAASVISIGVDIITVPSGEGLLASCFLTGVKTKVKSCVKKKMCKSMVWFEMKRGLENAVKVAAERVAKQKQLIHELEKRLVGGVPGYQVPIIKDQIHQARLLLDGLTRELSKAQLNFGAHLRTPCRTGW